MKKSKLIWWIMKECDLDGCINDSTETSGYCDEHNPNKKILSDNLFGRSRTNCQGGGGRRGSNTFGSR